MCSFLGRFLKWNTKFKLHHQFLPLVPLDKQFFVELKTYHLVVTIGAATVATALHVPFVVGVELSVNAMCPASYYCQKIWSDRMTSLTVAAAVSSTVVCFGLLKF